MSSIKPQPMDIVRRYPYLSKSKRKLPRQERLLTDIMSDMLREYHATGLYEKELKALAVNLWTPGCEELESVEHITGLDQGDIVRFSNAYLRELFHRYSRSKDNS